MEFFFTYVDGSRFQTIFMNRAERKRAGFPFRGKSIPDWSPPKCYIGDPRAERANFYSCGGTLAFDEEARAGLEPILARAGEVLPLDVSDSEPLYVLNVLDLRAAYDEENTVFGKSFDGGRGSIIQFAFLEDEIGDSSVFKLVGFPTGDTFLCSGKHAPADDFKSRYESLGLRGLTFAKTLKDIF